MLKRILLSSLTAITLLLPVALPVVAFAAKVDPSNPDSVTANPSTPNQKDICAGIAATGGECVKSTGDTVNSIVKNVINVLSFVVGVAAVIAIIIAGLQFVVADGDATKIAKARQTILFAIIGLVIVAVAQLIVVFVLNSATEVVPPK